ncbi:uncharacterized protein LOC123866491 isoform X2 [Maniola jurtina]|uniref:uncharacterized protein LOC123866491 isoform X2 n=1 Tax=Maniola jurtina TaxID=191418 RepID=UPI001E68661F|nr:uncharacterized protein LOC123866491 isoform X2 [Maniola jurtina]
MRRSVSTSRLRSSTVGYTPTVLLTMLPEVSSAVLRTSCSHVVGYYRCPFPTLSPLAESPTSTSKYPPGTNPRLPPLPPMLVYMRFSFSFREQTAMKYRSIYTRSHRYCQRLQLYSESDATMLSATAVSVSNVVSPSRIGDFYEMISVRNQSLPTSASTYVGLYAFFVQFPRADCDGEPFDIHPQLASMLPEATTVLRIRCNHVVGYCRLRFQRCFPQQNRRLLRNDIRQEPITAYLRFHLCWSICVFRSVSASRLRWRTVRYTPAVVIDAARGYNCTPNQMQPCCRLLPSPFPTLFPPAESATSTKWYQSGTNHCLPPLPPLLVYVCVRVARLIQTDRNQIPTNTPVLLPFVPITGIRAECLAEVLTKMSVCMCSPFYGR